MQSCHCSLRADWIKIWLTTTDRCWFGSGLGCHAWSGECAGPTDVGGCMQLCKANKKKIYNIKLQHKMRMTDSAVNDNTQIEF